MALYVATYEYPGEDGQNVEQEAPDKLVCCQCQDLLPVRTIVLIAVEK